MFAYLHLCKTCRWMTFIMRFLIAMARSSTAYAAAFVCRSRFQVTLARYPQDDSSRQELIKNAVFSTTHGLSRTSLQNIKGKAMFLICCTQVANKTANPNFSQNHPKARHFLMESLLRRPYWTLLHSYARRKRKHLRTCQPLSRPYCNEASRGHRCN